MIKSQVSEAFVAAEGIKKEIESQKALTDKFDINLVKINSSSMRVDDEGNVFYTFKDKNKNIDNKVVMFYLDENSINKNTFIWNCISDLDKKYLPSSIECFIDNQKTDNPQSENKQKTSANFILDDINISIFTYQNGDIEISSEKNGEILDKLLFSKDTKKTSYIDFKNPNKNFEKDFDYDQMINEANKYSSKFFSDDLKYFISDIFEFDILDPESENYISK